MSRFWLILVMFALAAPYAGRAAEPAADAPAMDENVQEPDEGEGEMEAPKNLPPLPPPEIKKTKPSPPEGTGNADYTGVILRGLNKVTARAQTIEAPIGSVERFGTIEIIVHRCWKADPEERPEDAAFMEISDIKQGEAPRRIFLGWMFSSSPALSALEHPFYDITVVKCTKPAVK